MTGFNQKRKSLRQHLEAGPILIAPGAYDVLTARLAERTGFPVVYMAGAGISFSAIGVPDLGLVSYTEVLDRLEQMAEAVDIPLIADADNGYGNALSVIRTVKSFESRGASAIQIEDQQYPKRCGHEFGRKLISTEEMVGKINAALDARTDPDFLLIARTDARTSEGIEAAIERGLRYQEAGADVIFVESPESIEELRQITSSITAPTLANMVEGGRTPLLSTTELQNLGFRVVIFPNSLIRFFCKAGMDLLLKLKSTGSTLSFADRMLTHDELWLLFGADEWASLEKRYIPQRHESGLME
jgi:carboxyvinyl-carboxyphosphonate phosphorylmutase